MVWCVISSMEKGIHMSVMAAFEHTEMEAPNVAFEMEDFQWYPKIFTSLKCKNYSFSGLGCQF